MNVEVTTVTFSGNQADAAVSITPKGVSAGGMNVNYHLEQDGAKWVVKGRKDAGGAPHGGGVPTGAMPSGDNPHGGGALPGADNPHGAAPGGASGGRMPSPEDLPPSGKKK